MSDTPYLDRIMALARPYERVEHGRMEHVGGYQEVLKHLDRVLSDPETPGAHVSRAIQALKQAGGGLWYGNPSIRRQALALQAHISGPHDPAKAKDMVSGLKGEIGNHVRDQAQEAVKFQQHMDRAVHLERVFPSGSRRH